MQRTKFNFTTFIKTSAISFLIVIFFLGFSSKSFAATGIYEVVNFQGKVVNKTPGTNVTNGNYDFTFKIFSVASAGTVIWTENFNTANGNQLTVTDGIFRAALGSVCTFGGGSCQGNTNSAVDFNSDSLYLDITFNGETFGTRVRLTAVPYAFNAKQVNGLTVTNNGGNTLNIAANKTLTASNTLTFAGTDSTTITFQGTDTYVGRTTTDTLTNKTIGSTGLTFSGAATDVTTVSNEDLTLAVNGSGNFVLSSDFDSAITLGTAISNEFPLLVRNGIGNNAALAVDNLNLGDIFTASASGTTRFSITSAGGIKLGIAEGILNNCLLSGGAGAASTWGSCGGGSQTPWTSDIDADNFSLLDFGTNITARAALTIASTGSNTLTLDSGNNIITFAATDTTLTTSLTSMTTGAAFNLDSATYVRIGGGTPGSATTNDDLFVTQDLEVDGVLYTDGGIDTVLTLGSVVFAGTNGVLGEDNNNFFFDDSTNRLKIGHRDMSLEDPTGALAALDIRGTLGTLPTASISAKSSFASLVVDNKGFGDIFAASKSGATKFVITNSGNVGIGTAVPEGNLDVKGLASVDAVIVLDADNGSNPTDTWFIKSLATGNSLSVVNDTTEVLNLSSSGALQVDGLITASTGLTVTAGQNLTVNSQAFTDLTGNGLTISGSSLTVGLSTGQTTGSTSSNSGLEVDANGLSLLRGCTDGQLLEYTDAGGWACAADDTGGGGGGSSNWTIRNGALKPNNDTLDILFGGTSTSSAKFAFMNMDSNSGLDPLASFSGNLMLESRPNSTTAQQTTWTKISQTTPGTIMSSGTANISSISAMTVYNGSLYVGTFKGAAGAAGEAEVYRYKGTNTSWERVSSATPGTIGGTGTPTSGIASVSAMTVFDGRLYIGTSKMNQAEVYRYDGGTTWIKVSNGTAGTIGGTANIDGVASMAVYQGQLYIGTREHTTTAGTAQIFRYNNDAGASGWTVINSTAGQFVATNTVGVWAVTNMVVKNGYLYFGVLKPGDADVLRYQGGAGIAGPALSMNLAGLTGSYLINGTAVTQFSEITAMAVYNGNLVVGLSKPNGAEVLTLSDGGATTTVPNSWLRLNSAAGTMVNGGTANIDAVTSLAVYNGSLYIGTREENSAEIYRYTGGSQRFFKVSGAAGTIATGDTSAIDGVVKMIQSNGDLIAATQELGRAEIYKNTTKPIDSSYALQFHAKPSIAGGEQNSVSNYASIFFMASASANLGSNAGNGGAFVFSHGIQTKNGSYDVAEDYPTRDDSLEPGDLVAIDTSERGFVKRSSVALDAGVIGVYSEKPALRLTQEDVQIDGGRVIPVALAGRVPVKVSTQNGKIKPGDYLTASSIPGVAMKATKTGNVVGQAMASYGDEGIGRITVYVRSNSYSGTSASLFEDIDSTSVNFEQEILTKLLDQKQDGLVSEINTDRVIAGLEIITPRIVTDELIVKKIRAEQIEGLEIITGKISSIDSNIASLSAIFNSSKPVVEIVDQVNKEVINNPQSLLLTSLNVDGIATISADLRVKGSGLVEGIFSIVDTLVTNNLIVNGVSNFFAQVIFKEDVIFEGRPTFNSDTGGSAIVKKDSDRVEVVFDKEYEKTPVISANITFDQKKNIDGSIKDTKELEQKILEKGYSFVVVSKSAKGFTIVLNKRAEDDIEFSWIALSIKETKISFSKEILNLVQQVLSPTPSISASNSAVQNGP